MKSREKLLTPQEKQKKMLITLKQEPNNLTRVEQQKKYVKQISIHVFTMRQIGFFFGAWAGGGGRAENPPWKTERKYKIIAVLHNGIYPVIRLKHFG